MLGRGLQSRVHVEWGGKAHTALLSRTGSPCGWIMRRYLSLLDTAVALEVHEYDGPRLDPKFRVQMFSAALTADEANGKYRWEKSPKARGVCSIT